MMSIIAWTDWKTKRIQDGYVFGIFVAGIISIFLMSEISLLQRIYGMFLVSVPLLILSCVRPGSIGGGDVKLMAAGGLLLGATGIWNAFVTGVMSAGTYILVLLIVGKVKRKSEIALGPFLSIGMILTFLKISY